MHIETIQGQPLAISQIKGLYNIVTKGGPLQPVMVHGPSGCGKDHTITRILADLQEMGWRNQLHVKTCDDILLQKSSTSVQVASMFNSSQAVKTVVVLNECHKLFKGSRDPSAQERDFLKFIYPHGDGVQRFVEGDMAMQSVLADFENLLVICATNEPSTMETTASKRQAETPFLRRFYGIELCPYDQEVIVTIIPKVFEEKLGVRVGECASGLVSRLHRGTMTAVVEVTKRLKGVLPNGKKTANKEEILKACQMTEYLPRGLFKIEGTLLKNLVNQPLSGEVCSSILKGKKLSPSFLHLSNQYIERKDGGKVHSPMIIKKGSLYAITDFGKSYIKSVEADGFSI